jgi:hypothetical protein
MSSQADKVRRNIIWHIAGISPTSKISGRLFVHQNRPHQRPADMSSGTTRSFYVQWLSSGPVLQTSQMYQREREHLYEVVVSYSNKRGLDDTFDMMLQDSFDIVSLLRNDDSWTGYSDAESSTAIGLRNRVVESDVFEDSGENTFWLRQQWRCLVLEVE